jgi:hypothetical protein
MTNKDIIKQYVDTGVRLPEQQVNKFSPNLLRTYLRKRIIAAKGADFEEEPLVKNYEYIKMTDDEKTSVIPYVYLDYEELDKNELVNVVDKTLSYMINVEHLPQFIQPDYDECQVYNIFMLFLEAFNKNAINLIPLIKKMMNVVDSKLPDDKAEKEYFLYFKYVDYDKLDRILDYYISKRKNKLDEYDLEELDNYRKGNIWGSDKRSWN